MEEQRKPGEARVEGININKNPKRLMLTKVYLTDDEAGELLTELASIINAYLNRMIDAGIGIGCMITLTTHGSEKSPLQKCVGRTMMIGNHLAYLQIMELLNKHKNLFAEQKNAADRRMMGRLLENFINPEPKLKHIEQEVLDTIFHELTQQELNESRNELITDMREAASAQMGADPRQS